MGVELTDPGDFTAKIKKKMSDEEPVAPIGTLEVKDVFYCPISSLPFEYIEYLPKSVQTKCIDYMRNNLDLLKSKNVNLDNINLDITSPASGSGDASSKDGAADTEDGKEGGKSQKRGGKGATI